MEWNLRHNETDFEMLTKYDKIPPVRKCDDLQTRRRRLHQSGPDNVHEHGDNQSPGIRND